MSLVWVSQSGVTSNSRRHGLQQRGAGRRMLFIDMRSPTSGDPLQEWSKGIPVLCGASGLIWLDKANPEPKYLLHSGVKDKKSRCSLLSADHVEKHNFPPPLRSLQPLLIPQGGDLGHCLSWSRRIRDPHTVQSGNTQHKASLGHRLHRCTHGTSAHSEARRQPPLLCGSSHTAGAQTQLLVLPGAHALAAVEMSRLIGLRQ